MAALVRCSIVHISAGPRHREATFRGHLRQRNKMPLTCLTLEKKKSFNNVCHKIKMPYREPTTIHKKVRRSDPSDLQSHHVVTTLHCWIQALQFCMHQVVEHWKTNTSSICWFQNLLLLTGEKQRHIGSWQILRDRFWEGWSSSTFLD